MDQSRLENRTGYDLQIHPDSSLTGSIKSDARRILAVSCRTANTKRRLALKSAGEPVSDTSRNRKVRMATWLTSSTSVAASHRSSIGAFLGVLTFQARRRSRGRTPIIAAVFLFAWSKLAYAL